MLVLMDLRLKFHPNRVLAKNFSLMVQVDSKMLFDKYKFQGTFQHTGFVVVIST